MDLLTPDQIAALDDALRLASLDSAALLELRQACAPSQIRLSEDMGALLGSATRRKTPILGRVVAAIAAKLFIELERFTADTAGTATIAKQLTAWLTTWPNVERELYKAVVRDGRAFVHLGWVDGKPRYTFRPAYGQMPLDTDPRNNQQATGTYGCAIIHDPATRQPIYGVNAWQTDQARYVDFYYPDRIEKYINTQPGGWQRRHDPEDETWPLPWVDAAGAPLGIALVEFSIGESAVLAGLQTARDINEAQLDLVAVGRTQGWPQRYIIGGKQPEVVTNEFGQAIVHPVTQRPIRRTLAPAPGSMLKFQDGTTLGQLTAASANDTVLSELWGILSYVTTVPVFKMRDGGQMPSGVALIQAESALNSRVEEMQGFLSGAMEQLLRLTIRVGNYYGQMGLPEDKPISIPFAEPVVFTPDLTMEMESHKQDSIISRYKEGLMSLEEAVRQLNPSWTEEQVEQEVERINEEKQAAQPVMAYSNGNGAVKGIV